MSLDEKIFAVNSIPKVGNEVVSDYRGCDECPARLTPIFCSDKFLYKFLSLQKSVPRLKLFNPFYLKTS